MMRTSIALGLIAFVVSPGLAMALPPCRQPHLPDGLKIEAPDPAIPTEQSRFLGVWKGIWSSGMCATLAVVSVDRNSTAKVVLADGALWFTAFPGDLVYFPEASTQGIATIVEGQLTYVWGRVPVSFSFDGDKLSAVANIPANTGPWNYLYGLHDTALHGRYSR